MFTDYYGYRKHIRVEHTYDCNYCTKKFTMKKFLNAHQYYIHNLIAPGMKIPTDNQKEEAIIKAFKEEMKELIAAEVVNVQKRIKLIKRAAKE